MELRADFWTQELWENQFKLFLASMAVICGSSHRELMKESTRTRQSPSQELFPPRLVKEGMWWPGRQEPHFLSTLSLVAFLMGGGVG